MTHGWQLHWRVFTIPKWGNAPDENEDAAYPLTVNCPIKLGKGESFSCALSDGATQSSFSRLWANILADEASRASIFISDPMRILEHAIPRWKNQVSRYELPWHAEEKVRRGAFATLVWLGIKIIEGRPRGMQGSWKALVLGDSCLFQLREGVLISSAPEPPGPDFSLNPVLFSSIAERNQQLFNRISSQITSGDCRSGDQFILVSDALAEWIFKNYNSGCEPFKMMQTRVFDAPANRSSFAAWVNSLREEKSIKNDDTTLASVMLE